MKRGAAVAETPWLRLCSRLGVEPGKFAVLLAVAGGAIVLLAGKAMLSGPKSASAKTPTKAAAPATAGAPPRADGAARAAPSAKAAASEGGAAATGAIEVRLDTQPRRDPFRSFIERPDLESGDPSLVGAPGDTPIDLAIFRLRATMDGEWVVINDQTLRVGDTIGVAPDGLPIKLVEVAHRRAVVQWRDRRFELSFPHETSGGRP